MSTNIDKAVRVLNRGGIVIFPTDTAFGIGCRIDNKKAVKRLFEIRKRPVIQPTPVLVSNLEMIKAYVSEIPDGVKEKLIDKFWPGALTIILKAKKEKVPDLVRGGGENIGLRMPNHKILLQIIENTKVPILGPSANFHGEKTPFEYQDLDKRLLSLVDFVLEGECLLKQPSTVIDCSVTPWKILRNGAIQINI